MKVRTLIAIAATGFLAASLAHAMPAAADDAAMDSGTTLQAPVPENMGSLGDQSVQGTDSNPVMADSSSASANNGVGTGTDDTSADTATGDDDY